MNPYVKDYQENIKSKKSCIYRNFKSKKRFKMYFEKLPTKEREKYMEEKNLIDININTITWPEIKKLSTEMQKFILDTWIEKYGDNNSTIQNNTAVNRANVHNLRIMLNYPNAKISKKNSKGHVFAKDKTNTIYKEAKEEAKMKEIKEVKEAKNNFFSISLNLDCTGEETKQKIEAVGILLDLHKEYKVNIMVEET